MKILKIFCLFLFVNNLTAQEERNSFENISTFSGLSASQTKCVYQDSDGYLWIGTMGGGLNRYDGNSFIVYKHNIKDSTTLGHNNVYSLDEDNNGDIWMATSDGVSRYVKAEDRYYNYFFRGLFKEISELGYYSAYKVFVDSKGRLWVGDSYFGALLFDRENNLFEPIPQQTKDSIDSLPQVYGDITEDSNGRIWVSAGISGLFWFDENQKKFRPAEMNPEDWNLLKSKEIFRVNADSKNNIWIMTRTDLYKYITSDKKIIHLLNYEINSPINGGYEGDLMEDSEGNMLMVHINIQQPMKFPNLSNKSVKMMAEDMSPTDIYEDSFGIVWVTDWIRGIFKMVPTKQVFYQLGDDSQNFWSTSKINSIYQSSEKPELIFVSSAEYGKQSFKSYNWNTGQFKDYNIENVSAIIADKENTYWLGTWTSGLINWNIQTGEIKSQFADSSKSPNLFRSSITNIKRDNKRNYWIGTLNGLYRMDAEGNNLELIIADHGITQTYFDNDILWLGAYNAGFIKYNLVSNEIEEFKYDKSSNSVSNNIVWDFYRDNEGFLWLATAGGLNRMDLRTSEFEVFDEADGLESNYIAAILPDDNNGMWISTSSGISLVNKDSKNRISFSNYNSLDGLNNPNFEHAFRLKDNKGRLYFGGQRGLYYFTPQKRRSNPPIIHITDIIVNGKPFINPKNTYYKSFSNNEFNLQLNHDQNTISFEFTALHFAQPSQNRYSYFLEGYQTEWQYSKLRDVQYVNLNPGTYKFHFRAANRDGIWTSEKIILPISIGKPWWNTWYAYTTYFLLVLGFLFTIRKLELKRRNEIETKRLLEAENNRKTEELEEARKLQLSMLPKEIPNIPLLDIAVYMKTATEVGGDYYDFHVSLDGTITVVIGDATGHGMRAGTMVTSTKSLFSSYAENDDIINTFHEMTRCIKNMHMDNLAMCLTMIKIQKNRLRMSSAGMPPVYLYRKNTSSVEEYLFQGMPLGSMSNFPYEIRETMLNPGDTILLMSDGFPELLNKDKEMLGFKRTKHLFEECVVGSPEDIISSLKNAGSDWVNDNDPDDDVTFVVIKVK